MKRLHWLGATAALALALIAAPAFAGNVTVGRFYTELAKAKHLGAVDAVSAEASLRAAGFRLPSISLDKTLTEGDVAAISTAMGVSVSTTRPTSVVNESQMNQFVGSYGSQFGINKNLQPNPNDGFTPNAEGDPGNSGNGKGQKKGHNKSTSEPV